MLVQFHMLRRRAPRVGAVLLSVALTLPPTALAQDSAQGANHAPTSGTPDSSVGVPMRAGQGVGAVLPPATDLERFRPPAGTLILLESHPLGRVQFITVEARETRFGSLDAPTLRGVRGLVLTVPSPVREALEVFVDADELPNLLRAIDTLLTTRIDPAPYTSFELSYGTKGGFFIATAKHGWDPVRYEVRALHPTETFAATAKLNPEDLRQLRRFLEEGHRRLTAAAAR